MKYTSDYILKARFFSSIIYSYKFYTVMVNYNLEHCLHITNSTTCNKIIVFIDFLFNQHIFI